MFIIDLILAEYTIYQNLVYNIYLALQSSSSSSFYHDQHRGNNLCSAGYSFFKKQKIVLSWSQPTPGFRFIVGALLLESRYFSLDEHKIDVWYHDGLALIEVFCTTDPWSVVCMHYYLYVYQPWNINSISFSYFAILFERSFVI